ncbi:MAG TPA: CpXC domain-containing protein [Dictyobacter sp.]|jgi:hypothetical protein|nr:CpXC domain-containing protein [Dictyobacter sp.]
MSRSTTHTFTCPCGHEFTGQIYEHVNVADNPQLRYIVMSGLINVSICPNCGRHAAVSTPFIYSDPEHHLLAYVHPDPNVPEEGRMVILEQLRSAYVDANKIRAQQKKADGSQSEQSEEDEQRTTPEIFDDPDVPSLQVIFGIDQLNELLNALLDPEEKLGRLALSTQNRSEAARGQFHDIARKLATEMGCIIEVEDLPDEYTVWLYGSRRQIGALMRDLAPRG